MSYPGHCLTASSTWASRWKRSSSSSSATWSTRRSTAPRRASRQSKRRPWSLWKLKALTLLNSDQIHTMMHTSFIYYVENSGLNFVRVPWLCVTSRIRPYFRVIMLFTSVDLVVEQQPFFMRWAVITYKFWITNLSSTLFVTHFFFFSSGRPFQWHDYDTLRDFYLKATNTK